MALLSMKRTQKADNGSAAAPPPSAQQQLAQLETEHQQSRERIGQFEAELRECETKIRDLADAVSQGDAAATKRATAAKGEWLEASTKLDAERIVADNLQARIADIAQRQPLIAANDAIEQTAREITAKDEDAQRLTQRQQQITTAITTNQSEYDGLADGVIRLDESALKRAREIKQQLLELATDDDAVRTVLARTQNEAAALRDRHAAQISERDRLQTLNSIAATERQVMTSFDRFFAAAVAMIQAADEIKGPRSVMRDGPWKALAQECGAVDRLSAAHWAKAQQFLLLPDAPDGNGYVAIQRALPLLLAGGF